MPRYDSFLSLQSTPWFQAQFDLTLAALGKKRKKAARGVRFKSGLVLIQNRFCNLPHQNWLCADPKPAATKPALRLR